MSNISKLSIINNGAKIGKDIQIGAYCIIEDNVSIGDGNIIHPYVHIKSGTTIGNNNKIFQGSIIGEEPQDLKFEDEKTTLIIGNNNTIREHCTLNRGTSFSNTTIIKDDCLLMAYVHIAHDCIVDSKVILANGVQLGGHVEIGYHATVGGMSPVHQFCKVGKHSFIGGGRVALQDVPPYILATGEPLKYAGINSVGLRRRNFDQISRRNIKNAYKLIYKSNLNIKQAIESIEDSMDISTEIKTIIQFIKDSDRGLI